MPAIPAPPDCCAAMSAMASRCAGGPSSCPVLALALAAAIAIASATDPWFAATGVGRDCRPVRPVRAARPRRPADRARSQASRRPDHPARHRRARPARRRHRPAGGVARAWADAAGHAGRDRLEHSRRNRHIDPEARPGPVPGRYSARRGVDVSARLPLSELPGAELRLVPSLRGPVTAVNGVRVADMQRHPRRRLDPARRPRPDLRPRPAAGQPHRRRPMVAEGLSRPAAGQHRRRCGDGAQPQGRRHADRLHPRPADRGADRFLPGDRLAQSWASTSPSSSRPARSRPRPTR